MPKGQPYQRNKKLFIRINRAFIFLFIFIHVACTVVFLGEAVKAYAHYLPFTRALLHIENNYSRYTLQKIAKL